jgi:hypothetical protein
MTKQKYSPITQEVSDAANKAYRLWDLYPADAIAAATLRAVVEKILPKEVDPEGEWTEIDELRYQLLTVIVELEGGVAKNIEP